MKEPLWREVVSRAAVVVCASFFLAGAAGLFHAAWVVGRAEVGPGRADQRVGAVTLGLLVFGGGLAYAGLFLLKRAMIPSDVDETLPQVHTGERPDPGNRGLRSFGWFDDL